jgi:hypothetical protein
MLTWSGWILGKFGKMITGLWQIGHILLDPHQAPSHPWTAMSITSNPILIKSLWGNNVKYREMSSTLHHLIACINLFKHTLPIHGWLYVKRIASDSLVKEWPNNHLYSFRRLPSPCVAHAIQSRTMRKLSITRVPHLHRHTRRCTTLSRQISQVPSMSMESAEVKHGNQDGTSACWERRRRRGWELDVPVTKLMGRVKGKFWDVVFRLHLVPPILPVHDFNSKDFT